MNGALIPGYRAASPLEGISLVGTDLTFGICGFAALHIQWVPSQQGKGSRNPSWRPTRTAQGIRPCRTPMKRCRRSTEPDLGKGISRFSAKRILNGTCTRSRDSPPSTPSRFCSTRKGTGPWTARSSRLITRASFRSSPASLRVWDSISFRGTSSLMKGSRSRNPAGAGSLKGFGKGRKFTGGAESSTIFPASMKALSPSRAGRGSFGKEWFRSSFCWNEGTSHPFSKPSDGSMRWWCRGWRFSTGTGSRCSIL